jgi:hypothetical protein
LPQTATRAQGQGTFKFIKDSGGLSFKLMVANIENVTQAHIHLAPVGEDGRAVVRLYHSETRAQLIRNVFNGVLAEGVITDADFLVENFTLVDLIKEINDGNAYVNVSTLTLMVKSEDKFGAIGETRTNPAPLDNGGEHL